MLIALLIGPFVIDKLREFQIGQYIREDGPKDHQKKAGTPTMGGVLICIAILLPTLLWSDLANPFVWLVMISTLAFGAIGFADDYIKVIQRRNLGLTAVQKMGLQIISGVAIALVLLAMRSEGVYSIISWCRSQVLSSRSVHSMRRGRFLIRFICLPAFRDLRHPIIVGSSNAVNRPTDWTGWPSA